MHIYHIFIFFFSIFFWALLQRSKLGAVEIVIQANQSVKSAFGSNHPARSLLPCNFYLTLVSSDQWKACVMWEWTFSLSCSKWIKVQLCQSTMMLASGRESFCIFSMPTFLWGNLKITKYSLSGLMKNM